MKQQGEGGGGRDALEGGREVTPNPLQGAQPMPSHHPPDGKCLDQWPPGRAYPYRPALYPPFKGAMTSGVEVTSTIPTSCRTHSVQFILLFHF